MARPLVSVANVRVSLTVRTKQATWAAAWALWSATDTRKLSDESRRRLTVPATLRGLCPTSVAADSPESRAPWRWKRLHLGRRA